jgi:serine/threonine-protein kinase HipA
VPPSRRTSTTCCPTASPSAGACRTVSTPPRAARSTCWPRSVATAWGAVQLLPPDETPADIRKIDAHPLTPAAIAAELAGVTSPAAPAGELEDFRISIAGAQEKTAFLKHQGKWCRPIGSTPTTHIFKLPLGLVGNRQADMRTSVENEWLCARIVAAFGIPVAHCEIGEFGASKVLMVERFDRTLHSSGKYWLRLMQEDFAQATGTPWHRKYQADGGPGLVDIARILRGSQESQRDLTTLFRAQLLFFLLAATDGPCQELQHPHPRRRALPAHAVVRRVVRVAHHRQEGQRDSARENQARDGAAGERPRYHLQSIQRRTSTRSRKSSVSPPRPMR